MFKLGRIADVAAKRHGWSPDRVQNAENEYRKFLYLLMLRPEEMLVPWHDDLDLFWHEHILHTEQYAVDCRHLFGRFNPPRSVSQTDRSKAPGQGWTRRGHTIEHSGAELKLGQTRASGCCPQRDRCSPIADSVKCGVSGGFGPITDIGRWA